MKNLVSWIAGVIAVIVLIAGFFSSRSQSPFPVAELGRLPVWSDGRLKPLDSVARQGLLSLSGHQSVKLKDGKVGTPMDWMAEILFDPEAGASLPVFLIQHPDLKTLVNMPLEGEKRISLRQLISSVEAIEQQADLAESVPAEQRSPFQKEVVNLRQKMLTLHRLAYGIRTPGEPRFSTEVALYQIWVEQARVSETRSALEERYKMMDHWASLRVVPPLKADGAWKTMGDGLVSLSSEPGGIAAISSYLKMLESYEKDDVASFQQALEKYKSWLNEKSYLPLLKVSLEYGFNRGQWFNRCGTLYLMAFILVLGGWFWNQVSWIDAAVKLAAGVWVVHTLLLLLRMWIQGRPPVTNLYSSAIFVGWAAALYGLVLDRGARDGIGTAVSSMLGFSTLLIAHHLSTGGDTLETLRAVLDSNFWLATHVVVITLGYAATFVAGFLGILYVVRGVWTESLSKDVAQRLIRMAYGTVCFATLFSFVGTVLGGIWADQSWGRFWGWDPKENGALLIVLWNALLLHMKWGGMVRERGFMVMTIIGNIVTSLSWFGVNMLGIGLHSYGFMEESFLWLCFFISTQIILILIGFTPLTWWKSGSATVGNSK